MPGLEPEFQNLVEHLLPQLTSSKKETQDLYLQVSTLFYSKHFGVFLNHTTNPELFGDLFGRFQAPSRYNESAGTFCSVLGGLLIFFERSV
jgi:hypothetical protein